MNKTLRLSIIIATSVAIIGLIMATIGWIAGGMEPVTIGSNGIKVASDSDAKSIDESFDNINSIDIDVDVRRVIIKSGNQVRVTSKGVVKNFSVKDNNGTLEINEGKSDEKITFSIFGFGNESGSHEDLVITCPDDAINKINITSDTGDIDMSNLNIKDITTDSDTGHTKLTKIDSESIEVKSDTGDLTINKTVTDSFKFNLDTGDVKGENNRISSVNGELDTGSVNLKGQISGPITIKDNIGDVKLELTNREEEYSYNLVTDIGDINLNGQKINGSMIKEAPSKPEINIKNDTGSISITTS